MSPFESRDINACEFSFPTCENIRKWSLDAIDLEEELQGIVMG